MMRREGVLLLAMTHSWLTPSSALKCPECSQNRDGTATRKLILNPCGEEGLPLRFRTSSDPFPPNLVKYEEDFGKLPNPQPSLLGYSDTRMSGSSQFCIGPRMKGLLKFLAEGITDVVMVDMRMESHGFIGEAAVSYFCPRNWDLLETNTTSLQVLEEHDFAKLSQLSPDSIEIYTKVPGTERTELNKQLAFANAQTERQVMDELGVKYVRIPSPDHRRPRDEEVESLVSLFTQHPTAWLYFHCKMGKGRTTTAMIMRDIFINAHRVSLEDIILRNYVTSRVNLEDWQKLKGSYKLPYARERIAFLHTFYQFALGKQSSWKKFLQQQIDLRADSVLHPKIRNVVQSERDNQCPLINTH